MRLLRGISSNYCLRCLLVHSGRDESLEVTSVTNKSSVLLVCVLHVRVHFLLTSQLIYSSTHWPNCRKLVSLKSSPANSDMLTALRFTTTLGSAASPWCCATLPTCTLTPPYDFRTTCTVSWRLIPAANVQVPPSVSSISLSSSV